VSEALPKSNADELNNIGVGFPLSSEEKCCLKKQTLAVLITEY
jgi:hypothetical protein